MLLHDLTREKRERLRFLRRFKVLKRVENGKEIVVQNADIIVLQRIFYAMQDVCATEDRCQWEDDRLFHITQHLSHTPGGGEKKGLVDSIISRAEAKDNYRRQLQQYQAELNAAEEILTGIKNPNMRTFVVLLYVLMLPGEEVRKCLNMTEYGFKRARKSIEDAESMQTAEWVDKYVLRSKNEKVSKNT